MTIKNVKENNEIKIICETQMGKEPEPMVCTDVKVHFLAVNWKNLIQLLTHFRPMFPFLTFSGGYRKGALAWNGLKPYFFEQFEPV